MTARPRNAESRSKAGWLDSDNRPLTDAREIRAIAHPVRLALLELLTREGPLTATQAADLVDESPSNCSFHLRTLAKYGFVEEAAGGAGRERPWQRVSLGQRIDNLGEQSEASIAGQAFLQVAHDRIYERTRNYLATIGSYPKAWQDASFLSSSLVYLTAEELEEIGEGMLELLTKYKERSADRSRRPKGARPVQLVTHGFPLPQTPSGN
jgi:DNA-binding transcriptional ArsR family regulator